jgi:two-component system response regulator BaeR
MTKHVLIIEDELSLALLVQDYLRRESIESDILGSGENAVDIILSAKPDLVILDIMLPGMDGLEICRKVRNQSDVPIIVETARVEEIDRLLGLELGADDYICKPFSPRELVARVKAVLRRVDRQNSPNQPLDSDKTLKINEANWSAEINGALLDLTRREFRLLSVICNRPGRVFSRSQLLELAFPDDADVFDRTIDSHIKNIRQKIKIVSPDWAPIRSVYGVGYSYDI